MGCISHGIKLVFLHFFEFLFWMGCFLGGFPGLNGVTALPARWGWVGEEGGRMLSRYSHWLSRPSLKMGGGYWLKNYHHSINQEPSLALP